MPPAHHGLSCREERRPRRGRYIACMKLQDRVRNVETQLRRRLHFIPRIKSSRHRYSSSKTQLGEASVKQNDDAAARWVDDLNTVASRPGHNYE